MSSENNEESGHDLARFGFAKHLAQIEWVQGERCPCKTRLP